MHDHHAVLLLAHHQFLQRPLQVEILEGGILLPESGGSFHSGSLHQGKVKTAYRTVPFGAILGVLEVPSHLQLLTHTAQ